MFAILLVTSVPFGADVSSTRGRFGGSSGVRGSSIGSGGGRNSSIVIVMMVVQD